MTTSPEKPSSAPSSAPSNKYLDSFRDTLEKRWQEFDAAVIKDAGVFANMRFSNSDYQNAKAAFDE